MREKNARSETGKEAGVAGPASILHGRALPLPKLGQELEMRFGDRRPVTGYAPSRRGLASLSAGMNLVLFQKTDLPTADNRSLPRELQRLWSTAHQPGARFESAAHK